MKQSKRFKAKAEHEAEVKALKAEVKRKFKRPDPETVRRRAKAILDRIEQGAGQ